MDALSEVLKAIKLDSTFFYNGEFSAAWCFRSPVPCADLIRIRNRAGGSPNSRLNARLKAGSDL